jgi:hypothetical protein
MLSVNVVMLNVTINPLMLNVVMVSVVMPKKWNGQTL